MIYKSKARLNDHQYIAELEGTGFGDILAIVTENDNGEIIRVVTFGENKEEEK